MTRAELCFTLSLIRMKPVLKSILSLALLSVLACAASAQNILPKSFAGWTQTGEVKTITQPSQADAAYPAVLNEYGFTDEEVATYTRPDGRKLTIKAARFKDATGAYGAFTFYRDPAMKSEQIGTKSASANERILFFRSNVLVDAGFDRVTGMSAAELRELAGMLPEAKATAGNLPTLPDYLPKPGAMENSAKYILGPQALVATKTPLTAELVNFNTDPEILTQNYSTSDGPVTLMLVEYPTPQIAIERLRAVQASAEATNGFGRAQDWPHTRSGERECRQQRCQVSAELGELRSRGHVERGDFRQQARQRRQSCCWRCSG